jgi:hypothetical protein
MDIDRVPEPMDKSSDIDAREFPVKAVFPNPNQGAGPQKWLFFVLSDLPASVLASFTGKDYKKA